MTLNLARNSALAVAEVVVNAVVLLVSYRLLLDILGAEALGLWAVVTAATAMTGLLDIGIARGLTRFVAVGEARGQGDGRAYIEVAFPMITVICAVLVLAAWWPVLVGLAWVLPAAAAERAAHLVPLSLAAFWLSNIAGVLLFSLNGLHRSDLRSSLTITVTIFYVIAAIPLAHWLGLEGLAFAVIMREIANLLVARLLLRRLLPALPLVPWRWHKREFREMIGYGARLQISGLGIVLFEPTVRLLLSKLGSLEAVAWYEMAARLVMQLRGLVVAANQVTVPTLAGLGEAQPEQARAVFRSASELTWATAVPMFAFLVLLAPLVSSLWFGTVQPVFVMFLSIMAFGWLTNTVIAPVYFLGMSGGRLIGVVGTHIVIGGTNLLLGTLLGELFGAAGVVTGAALSLALGSLYLMLVHRRVYPDLPLVTSCMARDGFLVGAIALVSVPLQGTLVEVAGDAAGASGAIGLAGLSWAWMLRGRPELLDPFRRIATALANRSPS